MILRAKYVMPSSHEVFHNGAVAIDGDEIVEVGTFDSIRRTRNGSVEDLGEIALLPGFINAHVHLDFGTLAGKIPPPGSFTSWVREVRRLRADERPEDVERAIADGARESLTGGATTVVDHSHTGLSARVLRDSPIRKLVHFELIGFSAARAEGSLRQLDEQAGSVEPKLTLGLAPHAPYSTSDALYGECLRRSKAHGYPLSSHVAETVEEEEFTRSGTGPFRELLEDFGISLDGWTPPGVTPVQHLHRLGWFDRSPLLVHGNYIRNEDIPILRDLNITVVYCPRSHAYFGHESHPFEKLFALGVNVAVGTDSLASCPSLSMLDELKFMYGRHRHVSPERVLTFAMLNGAKSLKVNAKIGGLRSGWKADLVGISLPSGGSRIAERILADESAVAFTMVGGEVGYRSSA